MLIHYRGTRLDDIKTFCSYSLNSHLNILPTILLDGGCSEGLDAFRFFFEGKNGKRKKAALQLLAPFASEFWFHEEGSAFPLRNVSSILHTQAEFGSYSWAALLPLALIDDAAAVCMS